MNFDEVTLIEIEDYIQALDENVGLKVETIQDIAQAINKQRGLVKKLITPVVSNMLCGYFEPDNKTSSATICKCGREKWEHPRAT